MAAECIDLVGTRPKLAGCGGARHDAGRLVDMIDQQAIVADAAVPFVIVANLQDEVFALHNGIASIGDVVSDRREDVLTVRQGSGFGHPAEHIAFDGTQVRRTAALVVVVAVTHNVVHRGRVFIIPVGVIVGVVEVRQAQGVGELVAGRADGTHVLTAVSAQLGGAEVAVEDLPAEGAEIAGALVGPDGVLRSAFRLVVAGEVKQDHVDVAVVVGIVIVDGDLVGHQFVSLHNG